MLEGDSKYSCEGCKKKVCALKRCTIKKLSPTLIIHLKRFEYNLERQSYHKLTNYFEFPTRINMEPYTKEGIDKKEKGAATVEGHNTDYFVSIEKPLIYITHIQIRMRAHTSATILKVLFI